MLLIEANTGRGKNGVVVAVKTAVWAGVVVIEGVKVMLGVSVIVGIGVREGVHVMVGEGGKYSYAIGSPYKGNATAHTIRNRANPNRRHPAEIRLRRRR